MVQWKKIKKLDVRKNVRKYKHLEKIQGDDPKEMDVTSKKTTKDKTYIIVHREIYTKTMSQFYQEFREITVLTWSGLTFIKYNSFYIGAPTEREKECFLCIKCQNPHLLPREIINLRKTEKLLLHDSVTKVCKFKRPLSSEELKRKHSEFSELKSTANYAFENKTETYFKDSVEKSHERKSCIDTAIK